VSVSFLVSQFLAQLLVGPAVDKIREEEKEGRSTKRKEESKWVSEKVNVIESE
jgi:hypothetical protein